MWGMKNSSMELCWFEEIWLLWFWLLWFQLLWFQLLWFWSLFNQNSCQRTQHPQLGNSFGTHPNGMKSTKWNFLTLFHTIIHILTKRLAWYPFLNFPSKMTFPPKLWPHPKSIYKFSKIKNWMLSLKPPYNKKTFHQYTSFTKYLYFLRYGPTSTVIPHIIHAFRLELFDLKNPKLQTFQNPSCCIIPNPNWT